MGIPASAAQSSGINLRNLEGTNLETADFSTSLQIQTAYVRDGSLRANITFTDSLFGLHGERLCGPVDFKLDPSLSVDPNGKPTNAQRSRFTCETSLPSNSEWLRVWSSSEEVPGLTIVLFKDQSLALIQNR